MPFKDKSPGIQQLLNSVAFSTWKRTVTESLDKRICVRCGEPIDGRINTPAGHQEYQISGLCEICYDEITSC